MNMHREIKLAKQQVTSVLDALQHFLGNDEALKLDMLEGETSLQDVVAALLAENEDDQGVIAALEAQVDGRALRMERMKHRIDARKKAIVSLMDCASVTTLRLPEATLSISTRSGAPKVANADELPDEFVKVSEKRAPDLAAIKAAVEGGAIIPGVVMTNGGASLTVRRK